MRSGNKSNIFGFLFKVKHPLLKRSRHWIFVVDICFSGLHSETDAEESGLNPEGGICKHHKTKAGNYDNYIYQIIFKTDYTFGEKRKI